MKPRIQKLPLCAGTTRMPRCRVAFLLIASVGWLAQVQILHAQDMEAYQEAVEAFRANMRPDKCAQVLAEGPTLTKDPRFEKLERVDQVGILSWMANCGIELEDWPAAYDAFGQLAPIAPEPDWAWHGRLFLSIQFKETSEAVKALHSWSKTNPNGVSLIAESQFASLLRQARDLRNSEDIQLQIHEILADSNYTSPDPLSKAEWMRVEHARLLLRRNRVEDAVRRLAGVVGVHSHIEMGADRLFDSVRGAFGDIDFTALAEREIDDAVAAVNLNPQLLQARYNLLQAYAQAGRMDDALRIADAALAAVAKNPAQFNDTDGYKNWLRNDRAYVLYALGRNEEALEAMRSASEIEESGSRNVSQVINLASLLVYEGRPKEALETLRMMGEASEYGVMWAKSAQACAAEQGGDTVLLEAALSFLRENENANVAALQQALLCTGKLEEAAALYSKRLADPQTRGLALFALQNWQHDPLMNLPFRRLILDRLETVRARPKVQDAILSFGRIQDLPFSRFYWGRF